MWLITPIGFFSVVRKPDDIASDTLTIRSRVKTDLKSLRGQYLPSLTNIVENAGTDYRFRATAPRADVSRAIAEFVQQINYDNFKDEVAKKQGKDRAGLYGKVWSVLLTLQR